MSTIACAPPATTWNPVTDASKWSAFDLSVVSPGLYGFAGGAFDGRYVYFAPLANTASSGLLARYDTTTAFTSTSSWSTFDTSTLNPTAKGFTGAAFDGRFLYLVPYNNGSFDGVVARFDTTGALNASSSWLFFDVSAVKSSAKGFNGAVFDGRYVYLIPMFNGAVHGNVVRYDTMSTFAASSSWNVFDLTTVNSGAVGFFGGSFDGRFVYLTTDNTLNGIVARYDTTGSFGTGSSWSIFDAGAMTPSAKTFGGAVTDGKYLYAVPSDVLSSTALTPRYDTTASFTASSSWGSYDVTLVNSGAKRFRGGSFDGRRVFFVPNSNSFGTYDGIVAAYDTTMTFTTPASWSVFDTTTVNGNAKGFVGAVFDGRYVYFVPSNGGSVTARFDAKPVSWLPRRWNASFL